VHLKKKLFPLDEKALCQKISRCYKLLAEYLFEGDNFLEGIEEYQRALKFSTDENEKADIHMQISFAYMNVHRVEQGVVEYENALDAMIKKEKKITEELKETTEIIKDLKDRIDELKQDLKEQEKKKKEEEEQKKNVKIVDTSKVNVLTPRKKVQEKRKIEGEEESIQKES